jgi:hypothetical protein
MALVVHQHLMLCLLKSPRALLMVVKAAAVPADDQEELHDKLFGISLCLCGGSLELALQVRQAMPDDKCVRITHAMLLVLLLMRTRASKLREGGEEYYNNGRSSWDLRVMQIPENRSYVEYEYEFYIW